MSESGESTPGRQALAVMDEINSICEFKKPNQPPKRSKHKVLNEETYIEEMGMIIQRDFFPDLERLKAQNEYLDALDRNDVTKLRELHLKYSGGRKPPTQRLPSPATFETPAHNSQAVPETPVPESEVEFENLESKLSLDQFLNSHTSEDNQSFEEIMIESEIKHRQKYSYLYKEEDKSNAERNKLLMLPSYEAQCALPERKLDIDTWTYKNKNYIMYIPDGVGPTQEELLEMSKRRQEITHSNTRITKNPFNEDASKESITELAKTQAKVLDGKIGVDGKELLHPDGQSIRGFSFIRTPSPCPGVQSSPLMTWGEIEGTPFRLDGSDTPHTRAQGPSFRMADPPRREQIAMILAEKAGERHRDKKQKAMDAARRQFAMPSPRPNTSASDRLATMSPAARRFATSKLKLGELRSNYSPSPLRNQARTPSSPRAATPKLNLGIKRAVIDNLTDDLLKINVPKRNKAADFF